MLGEASHILAVAVAAALPELSHDVGCERGKGCDGFHVTGV